MSDTHESEPDDSDQRPALLARVRPIAIFAFGAIVVGAIFSLAATGLSVAVEIWQRARGH
jgi:hypothetical protein